MGEYAALFRKSTDKRLKKTGCNKFHTNAGRIRTVLEKKKKRETTVTSPFGLHVGHYKAALFNPRILEVHRVLLLIPFQTGIVPRRWRRTVQSMLEKEPGAPWIHRLRIIELFDAQANAGFQIFVGRRMILHAVHKNLLQKESFGSTQEKWPGWR